MLTPHQGFTYNKFDKPNDWPELSSTFDYKIEDGKLLSANEHIYLSGPVTYTKVGSPTITDGVVSGFNNASYLQLNSTFNPGNNPWEMDYKVKVLRVGVDQYFAGRFINESYGFTIGFSSSNLLSLWISGNGTSWNIINGLRSSREFSLNEEVWIKIGFTGSLYFMEYSLDGSSIYERKEVENTSPIYSGSILLGKSYTSGYAYDGSIDLKETYIKVNGAIWFGQKYRQYEASNGVVTKNTVPVPEGLVIGNFTTPSNGMFDITTQTFEPFEYYPIIKTDSNMLQVESIQYGEGIKPEAKLVGPTSYTTVGNPTIVDGVASGFSSSDYLLTSQSLTLNNCSFEICCKATTGNSLLTQQNIYSLQAGNTSSQRYCLGIYLKNNNFYCVGTLDGTSWMNSNWQDRVITSAVANTTYWFKWVATSTTWNMYYSLDGENYTLAVTCNLPSPINFTAGYCVIGNYAGLNGDYAAGWGGSIDLNNTYIKVNNTLWFGKEDWTPCIFDNNSIVEFVGHKSDYSSYNTYALQSAIQNSGTYDVWIDNQKVFENITSTQKTNINWSNLALTTGYSVTTPEALKAHIVKITPSNKENKFTAFRHAVSSYTSSGTETTGVLQIHFELDNELNLTYLTNQSSSIDTSSGKLQAITSKTNELKITGINAALRSAVQLKRLPKLNLINNPNISQAFQNTQQLKYVDMTSARTGTYTFNSNYLLEKIDGDLTVNESSNNFANVRSLKQLPNITSITTNSLPTYITNTSSLQSTDIDLSNKDDLTKLDIYGTSSYRIDGLKSLKVSNEAPFTGTSPQINVSYTGLERNALVELFNSLPTVSNGQTIDITGDIGSTQGYTLVGSPTITDGVVSGFSANNYLETNATFNPMEDNWEILTKIRSSQSQNRGVFSIGSDAYSLGLNIYSASSYDYLFRVLAYSGSTTYLLVTTGSKNDFVPNVDYWVKIRKSSNVIYLSYSTNGYNFSEEQSGTIEGTIPTRNVVFGRYIFNGTALTNGSIDLNNTYIKVNNKLWFTGNQLSSNEIAIATNKGWTVTGAS